MAFGIGKKKETQPAQQNIEVKQPTSFFNLAEAEENKVLLQGRKTIKDLIAVDIERKGKDFLIIGGKYVRTYAVNGVPSIVSIGWLDDLFNFDGDVDTTINVVPADGRAAMDELTGKITQDQALLQTEQERGNVKNITYYTDRIDGLMAQRRALEQNRESMFYVQILATLYCDSEQELERQSVRLENLLKGRRIDLIRKYLKQEEAYKSALPTSCVYTKDQMRNFSTGALCACYPFYNSEICHSNGVYIGINTLTGTPVLIDFYDRRLLNNSNISVFGTAGSGKTFFVSLLTMRSALNGIRSVIIDPEGEYEKITNVLDGATVKLMPGSSIGINPMDIDSEEETDDQGRPTGVSIVDIKSKAADVLDLLSVMIGEIPSECRGRVANAITECYTEKGITSDPKSIFESRMEFDECTGRMVQNIKKKMPTLSDLGRHLLQQLSQMATDPNFPKMKVVYDSLQPYIKGGTYDLFDRETSPELQGFLNSVCLNFDVSKLERGTLRPLGMYIAMTWTWEKIIKKNPHIRKRIICDEAWMLVSNGIAGHEFTATALENFARRIRKRNGGLLVASQNFTEFTENAQGRAVLTNTACNILLRQSSTDIYSVQEMFRLSNGEREFLLSAAKGNMIIKMASDDLMASATPSPFEYNLIATQKM